MSAGRCGHTNQGIYVQGELLPGDPPSLFQGQTQMPPPALPLMLLLELAVLFLERAVVPIGFLQLLL